MNNLILHTLVLVSLSIGTSPVFGQSIQSDSDKDFYIQPMIGLDFAFFYPSDNKTQDRELKDIEEFLTYGIGLGYEWNDNKIEVSFSLASDVDAWDRDQTSLPTGYRYFDSYYQAKFSFSKMFYAFKLLDRTKVRLGGDAGVLLRKYKGRESLGASENFQTKNIEPNDIMASISTLIALDFNKSFRVTFKPIGVNFGFDATTYEVAQLGMKIRI